MNQFTFYANKPSQNYNKVDIWLLGSILLLWGLGIFTLYVCSQNFAVRAFGNPLYFVKRQLLCSAVGFVLFAERLAQIVQRKRHVRFRWLVAAVSRRGHTLGNGLADVAQLILYLFNPLQDGGDVLFLLFHT